MATSIPIPLGQQRSSAATGLPAARASMAAVEDPTGRAIGAAGDALGQIGSAVQRLQREEATAWVSKASSDDQIKWLQRMNELQDSAEPGAPDFTPKLLNEFDEYSTQALDNAPPEAKAFYRESLTRQRTYLGTHAVTFEAGQRRSMVVGQYQGGLEADAATIALDPSLYGERRATRLAALSSSSLPNEVRSKLLAESESTMAYAAGAAMIDRNPHAVYAAMDAAARGEATPGYGWIQYLDSDRIQQLRTRAATQSDRIDNRARIEQDRALARGQRAIGEMEKQMALGTPPRTDDMLRWASMTAGTEYEQNYRNMMAGLEEVQVVLRKPIAEQQAYIAEQRQVQQSGANTVDVANLDRLERAVNANVELMSTQPLQWIATRTGSEITSLNMAGLATPDGTSQIGAAVIERGDAIRAVQRANAPGMVQMRPLMPDEVQQIGTAFKAAASPQKREILAGLYRASGAQPDIFEGIVAQIEGVNPFLARVGKLAASWEDATLDSGGWFSPEVVQSAGDVAAIAIHGDEILRSGGKAGTLSYPVPKDEEFMTKLRESVTDLYRGTGPGDSGAFGLMENAYEIKAYYVGRAAQAGDFSGVIDEERLSQAVTAVVGAPVNYNDSGVVLAPWGMSADDFSRKASDLLMRSLAAKGMTDKIVGGALDLSLGLSGVGGGVYLVTLAGQPIPDPTTGDLYILSMSSPADSYLDTFGFPLSNQIPTGGQP